MSPILPRVGVLSLLEVVVVFGVAVVSLNVNYVPNSVILLESVSFDIPQHDITLLPLPLFRISHLPYMPIILTIIPHLLPIIMPLSCLFLILPPILLCML